MLSNIGFPGSCGFRISRVSSCMTRAGIYIVPTNRWYIERTVWLISGIVLLSSTALALLVNKLFIFGVIATGVSISVGLNRVCPVGNVLKILGFSGMLSNPKAGAGIACQIDKWYPEQRIYVPSNSIFPSRYRSCWRTHRGCRVHSVRWRASAQDEIQGIAGAAAGLNAHGDNGIRAFERQDRPLQWLRRLNAFRNAQTAPATAHAPTVLPIIRSVKDPRCAALRITSATATMNRPIKTSTIR
jgi:hypothetical protein